MNLAIKNAAVKRGITRLCHLTPSRNLLHIATDATGILASDRLEADRLATFNPVDQERLDGFPDHVCCSIQYPNAWYLRRVRQQDPIFLDWVVLLIRPDYLWQSGTKFSPRNAAANYGSLVSEGTNGFHSMFEGSTTGAGGRTFFRGTNHPAFLPTDEQAEVLIPNAVARDDILGVVVQDKEQAKRESVRMETLGARFPRYFVAPDLFDPQRLSNTLRSGLLPTGVEYREK